MTVKRIEMALHVQELCAKNHITVMYQSLEDEIPRYFAQPQRKLIQIRPTKNTGYYVSALHEIGHILGKFQSEGYPLIKRELYAWIYAMENALVWTETAERVMRKAMDSYGWSDAERDIWRVKKLEKGVL
jgi:hypothetical protein